MTSQSQENENVEQERELSAEEKLRTHEAFLSEMYQNIEQVGMAIQRMESFTFSMVKVLLDKNVTTFNELENLASKLHDHESLTKYWGVPDPEEAPTPTDVVVEEEVPEDKAS